MPAAESFRTLQAALLFSSTDDDARSLLLTSSVAGEGKTTVVVNLAVTMARAGSRVLIVDADLKRPNVHRQFDLSNDKGLTAVLRERMRPQDAPVPIDVPGPGSLHVVVAGTGGWEAAEVLASGSAGPWLAHWQRTYDHVLIDSAPVLSGADPLALARLVSGSLLVARMGVRRRDLEMSKERLEQVSVSLLGVVANAVSRSNAGYYYYDRMNGDGTRRRRGSKSRARHDGIGDTRTVDLRQIGEVGPEAQVDLGEGAR
jgi:capsular exopolysaccharide synthesis family protein